MCLLWSSFGIVEALAVIARHVERRVEPLDGKLDHSRAEARGKCLLRAATCRSVHLSKQRS